MNRHFSKKKDIKNSPQIGTKCSSWLIMRELQDVIFDLLETGKKFKIQQNILLVRLWGKRHSHTLLIEMQIYI